MCNKFFHETSDRKDALYKLYSAQDSQNVSDYKNMQTFMLQVRCQLAIMEYQHAQSTMLQYSRKRHKYQEMLLLILQTWSKLVSLMEKVWWVCEDRPLEQPLPDEQELLPESESESLQLHEPLSEPCTHITHQWLSIR